MITTATSGQTASFFRRQLEEWPETKANYDTLQAAMDNDSEIRSPLMAHKLTKRLLAYRKSSLSADITKAENGERPCFLCRHARPPMQHYEPWRDYEILVNPYPVGIPHFTIAAQAHIPQRIAGRIADMAELAALLPGCFVFYNGPKCGASAPDHMHFQAAGISMIRESDPLPETLTEIRREEDTTLSFTDFDKGHIPMFVIDARSPLALADMSARLTEALPHADPEPMMNIATFHRPGPLPIRSLIIPRRRHRPSCYGHGPGQVLVSPATIEMLGTIVTSRRADFDMLDAGRIMDIYREVSITSGQIAQTINNLRS